MRIFVDMDGTLAKWNNVEFEQLYEEGYYRNLKPNQKLVEEVNSLIHQGEDVYILSCFLSDSKFALKEKEEWCKEHLPELSEDKYIFVPFGESKAKVFDKRGLSPITNEDYLIDDYTKNLLEWKEFGGFGVKYLNGINHTKGTWQGLRINEKSSLGNDTSLTALVLGEKLKADYGIDMIAGYTDEAQENMIYDCIYNYDYYYVSVPLSFRFSCKDMSSYIYHEIDKQKTPSLLPYSFKDETNQYYSRHYPTLSNCRDFGYLLKNLDSETLDDMEYTLYLFQNTKVMGFDIDIDEVYFNSGYEFLENNSRINLSYIEWYECMRDTIDFVDEIQEQKNVMGLITKEEELDEKEY